MIKGGKSRKQRNNSEDPQTVLLRRIADRNEVTHEDILELYRINRPACEGCRVNNKDSPNCFCALIPSGASRKTGVVWQKTSDIEALLGPDPRETLRDNDNLPSGLTNLGATCYVNVVLQCLYRIKPFIQGFFAAEADLLSSHCVLEKLALIFGELRFGKKKAVDSAPFAEVLKLDNSIQQDGQEFLKLLLTSLEGLLGLSTHLEVRRIPRDVFQGTLSHVTRCLKCGQESPASKEPVDFYELELNVKGWTSLQESLDDYLSSEDLTGENQFLCGFCNARVDATRCTKLRSLPPVLNFQLKRFVFDVKTGMKKKVTSKFSFPQVLDMSSWINGDISNGSRSEKPLVYDLLAILIHKGNTTNSGHYVANIKDAAKGEWWEFDDELVTSLGLHPFGEVPEKPLKSDSSAKGTSGRVGKASGSQDGSSKAAPLGLEDLDAEKRTEFPEKSQNSLMSADAYTLIYNLRGSSELPFVLSDHHFPAEMYHKIDAQNKELEDKCKEYELRLAKQISDREDRKIEVKNILSRMPVGSSNNRYFWISSSWLRTWADELEPCPIDNKELLCEHGKVPPTNVNIMKRISEEAWASLQFRYGGGPELSADHCCIECVMESAKNVASASSFKTQRNKIKQLVEGSGVACSSGRSFFVSRAWLQNWLRRTTAEAPVEVDASPTAAITCPHKSLLPENAAGAKRQVVPEEVWKYFVQVAFQVRQDLEEGCLSFPVDTPACSLCDAEMMEVASEQQGLWATKLEEKKKFGALLSGDGIPLVPGTTYYLLPSEWLIQWRLYLGASGKKAQKAEQPIPLEESLRGHLCQKHKGLLFRPPQLERNRHGNIVQSDVNDDTFTVVSREDWLHLCERWSANQSLSIEAVMMNTQAKQEGISDTALEEATPMNVDVVEGCEDDPSHEDDPSVPILCTNPEVCCTCIEERESLELLRKLQYVDKEIYVDMVDGDKPPKALLESLKADRRVSKRPRRGVSSSSKRIVLKVSGNSTIHQIKLLIWESLSVVKENQRLHFLEKELTDDAATLSDLNILPGAHLWVIDTGLHENRDIAEEICKQDAAQMEEGFRGTLLGRTPSLVGSLS